MTQTHDYILTVAEVAAHFNLSARTVRSHLNKGTLAGVRLAGAWRCSWADIWAAEKGPMPRGARVECYKKPLLTKKTLAAKWCASERTVERWIAAGLPTRNVFGSVRIAPTDADHWLARPFGIAGDAA